MKNYEIRKAIVEWSNVTTFHCYPKIFQSKNIYAKFIWILFFLIFSCLTFWLVVKGILDYLEYDVVSKTRNFMQKSTPFPTITICDNNQFTTKEAEYLFNEESIIDKEIFKRVGYDIDKMNSVEFTLIKWTMTLNSVKYKAFKLIQEEKKSLGFSLSKTLLLCSFNGNKCSIEDFYWFYDFKWGNCFQFNSNVNQTSPIKETFLGGYNYGLTLFLGPLINSNRNFSHYSSGLKIYIHNGSILASFTDETFIETGKQTNIAIKKTFAHKAPSPHSQCQDLHEFKSDLTELMKELKVLYRQNDCLKLCLQTIIVNYCGCFYPELPTFDDSLPCFNTSQTACFKQKNDYSTDEFRNKCDTQCPLECDSVTYELKATSLDFPTEQYYETLKINSKEPFELSYEEYKKSHLSLNIYYPNVEYTEISEMPKMTLIDLISNLGGVLGIFLGFSIFSFVEILEILLRVLFIICKRKDKNIN